MPSGIYKHRTGFKLSEEHRRKFVAFSVPFKKGQTPWNKGVHMWEGKIHPQLGQHRHHTLEAKIKIGEASKGNQYRKGLKQTPEWIQMMKGRVGEKHQMFGKHHTKEARKKIKEARARQIMPRGLAHHKYNPDREYIKNNLHARSSTESKTWVRAVKNRDGWKCKMNDNTCCGKITAHHILGWKKFPELRYVVKNGITLCEHHHPTTREKESLMSPYFQDLIKQNG